MRHLSRRQGRVDGNCDSPGGQRCQIGNGPFHPVFREQRDAVARFNSQRAQAKRHLPNFLRELAIGQSFPRFAARRFCRKRGPVGILARGFGEARVDGVK